MTDLRTLRPPSSPSTAAPPEVPGASLASAAAELCDVLVRVHAEDRFDDLRLADALESLALVLWGQVLQLVGLPGWSATSAPRHRWVVLERAAWRLSQRVATAGIGDHPVSSEAAAHLDRVRALVAAGRSSRGAPLG
ncbi:MAG TPA: hypothetical protein VKZ55_02900 [Microthrixaceae bacterium]|nr:hypothetical protein [Microthrixaceae bacterium]